MKFSHETTVLQTGLKVLGFDPGEIDGKRGPATEGALAEYISSKRVSPPTPPTLTTEVRPPKSTTAEKRKVFGAPGASVPFAFFAPPFDMEFSWNGQKVTRIGCHVLVAKQFEAALKELALKGQEWIRRYGLNIYAGCYMYRNTRGGRTLSDHAWAVAFDLNPDANGNQQTWSPESKARNGTLQMPQEAVRIFRRHGFQVGFRRSDGSRRDMMHVAYINRD